MEKSRKSLPPPIYRALFYKTFRLPNSGSFGRLLSYILAETEIPLSKDSLLDSPGKIKILMRGAWIVCQCLILKIYYNNGQKRISFQWYEMLKNKNNKLPAMQANFQFLLSASAFGWGFFGHMEEKRDFMLFWPLLGRLWWFFINLSNF